MVRTTVQDVLLRITTPNRALVIIIANFPACIHPRARLTTAQAVLLRNTTTTRPIVIMIAN